MYGYIVKVKCFCRVGAGCDVLKEFDYYERVYYSHKKALKALRKALKDNWVYSGRLEMIKND